MGIIGKLAKGMLGGGAEVATELGATAVRGAATFGKMASRPAGLLSTPALGIMAGGAIGGIAGYAGSNSNTITGDIRNALTGATFGAAGGMAGGFAISSAANIGRIGVNAAKQQLANPGAPLPQGLTNFGNRMSAMAQAGEAKAQTFMDDLPLMAWDKAAKGANWMGNRVMFAAEHPVMAAGGIAGGLLGYSALRESAAEAPSPSITGAMTNVKYDLQALAAEEMSTGGVSPSGSVGTFQQFSGGRQRQLAQSTYGLVQGMHRGRHGGY